MSKGNVHLNNTSTNCNREFDECYGMNCNKIGIHFLSILFLDKIGYFCDSCKKDLEQLGLVYQNKE